MSFLVPKTPLKMVRPHLWRDKVNPEMQRLHDYLSTQLDPQPGLCTWCEAHELVDGTNVQMAYLCPMCNLFFHESCSEQAHNRVLTILTGEGNSEGNSEGMWHLLNHPGTPSEYVACFKGRYEDVVRGDDHELWPELESLSRLCNCCLDLLCINL